MFNIYRSDQRALIKPTCDGLFIVLFACMMQVVSSGDQYLSPSSLKVAHALSYIKITHDDSGLSVREIADDVGVTSSHLAHLFRRVTGMTIKQNIVRTRLEQAYRNLQIGKISVKEVAFRTGWKNQLYFSTCFRKKYGFPPSHVRNHAYLGTTRG